MTGGKSGGKADDAATAFANVVVLVLDLRVTVLSLFCS